MVALINTTIELATHKATTGFLLLRSTKRYHICNQVCRHGKRFLVALDSGCHVATGKAVAFYNKVAGFLQCGVL